MKKNQETKEAPQCETELFKIQPSVSICNKQSVQIYSEGLFPQKFSIWGKKFACILLRSEKCCQCTQIINSGSLQFIISLFFIMLPLLMVSLCGQTYSHTPKKMHQQSAA
ncbi:hypothetical protein GOODEAATRI_007835 [Goodea atripinnis]|uniref:Uncharacterized protein n=1 Tax=Goodea atripinnis TaxID=208336 RepID=A0ABV0PCA5_9TELE